MALFVVLGLAACCMVSLGEDIEVPYLPGDGGDGDGSGGGGDGSGNGGDGGGDGDAGDGGDGDMAGSTGTEVPAEPGAPTVPGDDDDHDGPGPRDGGDDAGGYDGGGDDAGTSSLPVETVPRKGADTYDPFPTLDPLIIVALIVVFGALALYAPGEIQRMRIESAFRESLDARLALAQGEFVMALAGFDRAIEHAHPAYTRRLRVDRPADWTLMPDDFYISLWRGRASALRGIGREKAAVATARLADELEAVVLNGH